MSKKEMVKNVFDWDYFNIYLSGPIDYADNGGLEWRLQWTEELMEIGFRPEQIFNPRRKPIEGSAFNLDDEQDIMRELRAKKDYDGLCEVMSHIAHIDLRLCDKSDLILVNIPVDSEGRVVYTYGTIHEIIEARRQRKPVFMVWEAGKQECSGWMMWLVGHRNVFSTFEELKKHLQKIANGKISYNAKEWLLINPEKCFKENGVGSN